MFIYILFRLFFGSKWPLNVSSILIVSTSSNLSKVITPLTILDNILNNNVDISNQISNNMGDFNVLSSLFSFVLSSKKESKYIYKTFNVFRNKKTEIKIHIDHLNEHCFNKDLLSLLFYDLVKVDEDDFNG